MTAPQPQPANAENAAPQTHTERLIGVEHGALHALADQLPEVNKLLETSFEEISTTFMQVASQVSAYRQQVEALDLPEDARESLGALSQDISGNISKIVMGMQFQDRVSQNLVITINVINDLITEWPEGESSNARDLLFAKSVLEKMKLGEFRQRYVDYLLEHNLISDPALIGHNPVENQSDDGDDDDDIDLF